MTDVQVADLMVRAAHGLTLYRKQIRPVVTGGAEVMDQLFPERDTDA